MPRRKTVRQSSLFNTVNKFITSYFMWLSHLFQGIIQFFKRRNIPKKGNQLYKNTVTRVERKPMTSFFTVIAILLLLIIAGSFLRRPPKEEQVTRSPKTVKTFSIGTSPRVAVQAQVEKSGIIKVVALQGGVVSKINVTEGQQVETGTTLVSLASNYSGGNAPTVQRQLAATQYQNTKDTYNIQKDLITKQREVANKSAENTEELRKLTEQSANQTTSLINLNAELISFLNNSIVNLPVGDAQRRATQLQISQLQGAQNQIESGQRSAQYQSDPDNPPTQLANLQKEIALKQLDIQERALKLALDTSALQLRLAQIQEAVMFPTAPFEGTVERVHVIEGQSVQPGTPLVTLHGEQTVKVVAKVPQDLAQSVSHTEMSTVHIDSIIINTAPAYITNEATEGSLYAIIYSVPSEYQNKLTNQSYITVDIPVGLPSTGSSVPFIPIDAIYQSQSSAYIFVAKGNNAESRNVSLGHVVGQYVEVTSGLKTGDEIILDRTVINGDPITKSKNTL